MGGGGGCSNGQNFHNCSVFKYSGVLFLSIPAFRVYVFRRSVFKYSGVPCLSIPSFHRSGIPAFHV